MIKKLKSITFEVDHDERYSITASQIKQFSIQNISEAIGFLPDNPFFDIDRYCEDYFCESFNIQLYKNKLVSETEKALLNGINGKGIKVIELKYKNSDDKLIFFSGWTKQESEIVGDIITISVTTQK